MNLEPDHYQFTDENQPIAYVLKSKAEAALKDAVVNAVEECAQVAADCPSHWNGEQVAKAIRRARGAAHD